MNCFQELYEKFYELSHDDGQQKSLDNICVKNVINILKRDLY